MENPILNRADTVWLAAQMLFPPPPARCIRENAPELAEIMREKQQKAIENNRVRRWQYAQDKFSEYLLLDVLHLPDGPINAMPVESKDGDGYITLEPGNHPNDGFVRILTTKAGLIGMLERAPASIRRTALLASVEGQIAGSMLWYIYHMSKSKDIKPSLAKARSLCLDRYPKRFNNPKGRPVKNSTKLIHSLTEGSLKRIWREFQPVAHLWAAYLTLMRDKIAPVHLPLENINLRDFLVFAKIFAEFGCEFRIAGTTDQHPLIRDELVYPSVELAGDLSKFETNLLDDSVLAFVK